MKGIAANGRYVNQHTLDLLKNRVSDTLLESLQDISDSASNYGASYVFEFAPRNLAVDGGQLILLDPVFDVEAIWHRPKYTNVAHKPTYTTFQGR